MNFDEEPSKIKHIYDTIDKWKLIYDKCSFKDTIDKRILALEKELESIKINNPELFFKGQE